MLRLLIIYLCLLLSACDMTYPPSPLRVAAHVWPGYELMFLARQEGWLDTSLVQLLETDSATNSLQTLRERRADAAALTLDEVLRARAEGIELSVLLIFNISAGADMLLAKAPIKDITELKGKRIGVEQGALGAVMLNQALETAGLSTADIEQVSITINHHEREWQADKVDAIITYEPVATQLLTTGAKKLFDSRQIPNMIIDVLAVRTEILKTHKTAIKHLISSHFQALEHFNKNPQDAMYRMAKRLKVKPEKVLSNYKGLLMPNLRRNIELLTHPELELSTTTQLLSETMVKFNVLNQVTHTPDLFVADFLPPQALN